MTQAFDKRVLIIAYHYPPCSVSSGIQRTLSFTRHLPRFGWQPIVLTVNEAAYEKTNTSQMENIPAEAVVHRTMALDTARHLAIGGRYWSKLTIPDRWRTWWLSAIPAGLSLIKKHRINAIWSTYPITTAHNIGATLSQLSGLPWIADFRDPMVEYVARTGETYPKDPRLRAARLNTEAKAAKRASKLVFCTESAKRIVAERYVIPESSDRLAVITNGFDEEIFSAVKTAPPASGKRRMVLLHSGTIYPGTDRDPSALLQAIKSLADQGLVTENNFELRMRNPSAESYLHDLITGMGLQSLVSVLPAISYHEALSEMMLADGLVILQGFTSNPAVPAKLYEYLRAGRPILGLVDQDGETAATLRATGIKTVADIADSNAISAQLVNWLKSMENNTWTPPEQSAIAQYSRLHLTQQLAQLLADVAH
jgi:glycosyltransferase involved in cell wall biosynthesis